MNRKFILPALVFLFSIVARSSGQISAFKINTSVSYISDAGIYFKGIRLDGSTYSCSHWAIGSPSLSLGMLSKKKHYHQVDFWPISYRAESEERFDSSAMSIVEGGKETLLSGKARYRYRVLSFSREESRIIPFIDAGFFFYYRHINYRPVVSLGYPEHETEFSAGPSIIPGVKFKLGDRFYLDFCIPVDLAETFLTINHIQNPALSEAQRTTSTLSIFTFRRWNAQFGFGIYL